jgi:hypothetical protein
MQGRQDADLLAVPTAGLCNGQGATSAPCPKPLTNHMNPEKPHGSTKKRSRPCRRKVAAS